MPDNAPPADNGNDSPTTPQDGAEPPKRRRGIGRRATVKQQAAALLMDAGMTAKEACETLGYSPKSADGLRARIKEKGLLPEIASKSNVAKATRVVKTLMEGRTFGEIERVKDSTALAAANVILDRAYPKQQDAAPQNVSFTVVNLALFAPDPVESKPTCIDVEPGQAPDVVPVGGG